MHTAMLLGTAKVLASMQKELPGTVYFIFQPGEEKSPGGALPIIKSGVLKGVDAIFGAHVMPNEPAGSIGILPAGAASSSSDGFFLTIQGKGSHGSMPQLGVDPIVTGSEIVMALQTVVSRNATPGDMAVITVGKFQSGNAPNVIPDKAVLGASIRSVTPETRKRWKNAPGPSSTMYARPMERSTSWITFWAIRPSRITLPCGNWRRRRLLKPWVRRTFLILPEYRPVRISPIMRR